MSSAPRYGCTVQFCREGTGELFQLFSRPQMTELLTVHAVDDPLIEVIFVHGLDGDPISTWSFDQRQSWIGSIRSKYPRARISSLQYRLRSSGWFGGSMPLTTRSRNVLAVLDGELSDTPIVFVCHSYGGLLVKQPRRRTSRWVGTDN